MSTTPIDSLLSPARSRVGVAPSLAVESDGREVRFNDHLRQASGPVQPSTKGTTRTTTEDRRSSGESDSHDSTSKPRTSSGPTSSEPTTSGPTAAESPAEPQHAPHADDQSPQPEDELPGDAVTTAIAEPLNSIATNVETIVATADETAITDAEIVSFDTETFDQPAEQEASSVPIELLTPTTTSADELAPETSEADPTVELPKDTSTNETEQDAASLPTEATDTIETTELVDSTGIDGQLVSDVTPDQQDARAESTTATDAVPGEEVLASNQNNDQQNPPSEQDAQEPAEKLAPSRRRDAQPGHRPADRAELAVADDVDGPLKDQALANAVANRPSTELAAEAIDVLDGDGDAAADTESTDAKPASSALLDGDRSAGLTGAINRLQRTPGRVAADNSAGTSPPTVRVDSARFVGRVAHAFRIAQERGGTLQLRLSPPELGSLKLEVSIHQGVLSAKIDAETTAARNALLDNLPALRDRLAEQNIRIEQFDVDVRQEGGDSRQFQPNQRRDDGHQSFRNAANIHGSDSTEEDTEPSAVPRTVDTNAAIDLII